MYLKVIWKEKRKGEVFFMEAAATLDSTRLILAAVAGLAILLVLIIKFHIHAMISILIGAVSIGFMAGMTPADIISTVNEGIGTTLKDRPARRARLDVRRDSGNVWRRADAGGYDGA